MMKPLPMRNTGNSCHAHVIIQVLLSCEKFSDYTVRMQRRNISGLTPIYRSLYANFILRNVKMFNESLATLKRLCGFYGKQQDSHESLILILNALHHENLMEFPDVTKNWKQKFIDNNLDKRFKKSLMNIFKNDYSFVTNFFTGIIMNVIACNNCKKVSLNVEKFREIVLPINKMKSVNEALKKYFSPELVEDYYCDKCTEKHNAWKTQVICSLPKYLIIVLKRFNEMNLKNSNKITVPEMLNLNSFTYQKMNDKVPNLILKGVIHHRGSTLSGHYFSSNLWNNKWYRCDDSMIREISMTPAVRDQDAYILFYYHK